MRAILLGAAAVMAAALIGCGHMSTQQQAADATTKALYNDDPSAMQARFDDDLRKTVTLDQVAQLSAKLHALGGYHGLSQTAADASHGRYDFTARFDHSTIPVHLRVDPNGQIAAYRLDIPEQTAAAQ